MDPFVLVLALIAALVVALVSFGIWRLLRRQIRTISAHSEPGSERSAPPAPQATTEAPPPEPPLPHAGGWKQASPRPAPVAALMTYTKSDGSTRVRSLTIYSRNLRDGRTHSLNCRQEGERITKQFLVSGIRRLEIPGRSPPVSLSSPLEIEKWLEQCIPEHASPPGKPHVASPAELAAPPQPPPAPPKPAQLTAVPPSAEAPTLSRPGARRAPLASLLPDGATGFAVLDLETTGMGRSCRIVEIALVRLDPKGRITEEWETLVHPGAPIPNGHVHGIDDAMVQGAPCFSEIAGILAAKLHQHVLVAHNLRSFDGPILEAHFAEVDGVEISLGEGVDTMPTPRVKLVDLCARHGVELDPGVAHTALGDTRALARALQCGMAHLVPARSAVAVHRNGLLEHPARVLTRALAVGSEGSGGSSAWTSVPIRLDRGMLFFTTGPKSTRTDTEIKRAEAHAIRLGLTYRKVNSIPKSNPPDFLLSTSLMLDTRKMREARDQGIPVILCRDMMRAGIGSSVNGWVCRGRLTATI